MPPTSLFVQPKTSRKRPLSFNPNPDANKLSILLETQNIQCFCSTSAPHHPPLTVTSSWPWLTLPFSPAPGYANDNANRSLSSAICCWRPISYLSFSGTTRLVFFTLQSSCGPGVHARIPLKDPHWWLLVLLEDNGPIRASSYWFPSRYHSPLMPFAQIRHLSPDWGRAC